LGIVWTQPYALNMYPGLEFGPLNPAQAEGTGECAKSNERFSETVEANGALRRLRKGREDLLETLRTIPTVLQSLLEELNLPAGNLDMPRAAELICRDESLAAHCCAVAAGPPTQFVRPSGQSESRGCVTVHSGAR
jgi:hypothetical protein